MWPFTTRRTAPKSAPEPATQAAPGAASCPTVPCGTCGVPMPIVAFDQACPRCRSLVPAARNCPGGCGSCEMGKQPG